MTSKQLYNHNEPTATASLHKKEAGMTLLEIIIVVALLGTLGYTLLPTDTTSRHCQNRPDQAGHRQHPSSTTAVSDSPEKIPDHRRRPASATRNPGDKRWRGPYIDSVNKLLDPWDAEFEYESDGTHRQNNVTWPRFSNGHRRRHHLA